MPEASAAAAYGWLLRCYPPSWRRRYGAELAAFLAEEPLSPAAVVDLLGGALDAWVSPQANVRSANAASEKGKTPMTARFLTCSSCHKNNLTVRESLIGAGIVLLGSLVLSLALLGLRQAYGNAPAVEALKHSLFPATMVLTANALYLQRRSWRAQAVFILFFVGVVYLITFAGTVLGR